MALIECPNCGHRVSDKATTCPNCSTELNFDETLFCKECGTKIDSGSDVCSNCGCPVEDRRPLSSISAEKAQIISDKLPEKNNKPIYNITVPLTFGIFLLLIGILNMPYGYYIFLRWAIAIIAIYISFIFWNKHETIKWITVGIAILFNPIIIVFFSKEIWIVLDIASVVIFIYIIIRSKSENK